MLEIFVRYSRYVSVLKWLSLSLFAYVATVFVVQVPWGEVAHALIAPSLSFTKDYDPSESRWAQNVKGSLRTISDEDAELLLEVLRRQAHGGTTYPVDQEAYQRLITHVVRRADKDGVPRPGGQAPNLGAY